MNTDDPQRTLEQFEQALAALKVEPFGLTLFVSGASASSAQAIENIRNICDAYLEGRYKLHIVDLNQEPSLAAEHQVLATPTLIKDHPLPARMLVGDMSNHTRLLIALDVRVPTEAYADGGGDDEGHDTGQPHDRGEDDGGA